MSMYEYQKNTISKPSGAIVIGGHIQGLGLLRSLGRHGIPLCLIDDRRCIGQYSKYCSNFRRIPDTHDETQVMACLREIAPTCNGWMLLPTSDAHVGIIALNRSELEKYYRISTVHLEGLKYFYNKKMTYQLAEELGVPYPTTYYPRNLEDLNDLKTSVSYPLILKPAIRHKFHEKTHAQILLIHNPQELVSSYQMACQIIPPEEILLQKLVSRDVRDIIEVGIFHKDGQIVASTFMKKFRQIPLDGGTGTAYETVTPDPDLLNRCQKILSYTRYYGICNMEFIRDDDGEYKLIDINPRTFKWHYLIDLAGINLPLLMYRDMNGMPLPTLPGPGSNGTTLKYFDEYPDLFAMLISLIRRKTTLREIRESYRGDRRFAVASWEDPLPFVMESLYLPWIFWKRRVV